MSTKMTRTYITYLKKKSDQERETYLIRKFNTFYRGMNKKDYLAHFVLLIIGQNVVKRG